MTHANEQHQCYLDDTYLFSIETAVCATGQDDAGRAWIALQNNIFHPQGGGQPSDVGWIHDMPAVPARVDRLVVVGLPDGAVAPTGEVVHARLDPGARLAHAALHTAGHLVDGLLQEQGYTFMRSNHFPGQARVEAVIDTEVDKDALRARMEHRLKETVAADLPVRAVWEGDTRVVSIGDLHHDRCGGTHLRSLAELHSVTIRSIKSKGGIIKVGYDAALIR
jgi:Ser-tRNA(Ala) deacylase AlaX